MTESGRLVLSLVVFAAAYVAAWEVVFLIGTWFGWPDDARLGSRDSGGDVADRDRDIVELCGLDLPVGGLEPYAPFRTVSTVQVLAAVLSISAQIGLTAVTGNLPTLMTPVLSGLVVSWMFLGPALITRTVFWFVAGHSHRTPHLGRR
jgi:hypothetical protein